MSTTPAKVSLDHDLKQFTMQPPSQRHRSKPCERTRSLHRGSVRKGASNFYPHREGTARLRGQHHYGRVAECPNPPDRHGLIHFWPIQPRINVYRIRSESHRKQIRTHQVNGSNSRVPEQLLLAAKPNGKDSPDLRSTASVAVLKNGNSRLRQSTMMAP
jgi:hypothetical protein